MAKDEKGFFECVKQFFNAEDKEEKGDDKDTKIKEVEEKLNALMKKNEDDEAAKKAKEEAEEEEKKNAEEEEAKKKEGDEKQNSQYFNSLALAKKKADLAGIDDKIIVSTQAQRLEEGNKNFR